MGMIDTIENLLKKSAKEVGIEDPDIKLEHPEDTKHGDFSSNIALIHAKLLKTSPKELAEKIVEELKKDLPGEIEKIEVAHPGFINFKIKDEYFAKEIIKISKNLEDFGKIDIDKGKKIMVEYTDPNPFKIFHIGHLMANAIGESLSRIVEFGGAKVIRVCYQGDVGLHVAKTVWGVFQDENNFPLDKSLIEKIDYLGKCYVLGNEKYETDLRAKKEIVEINKKIFEKSDKKINEIYEKGKDWSLEYFDSIYKKLGTKFEHFFFESEVAEEGINIVKEFLKKGIFEESEGAIVFKGEKYGEHTRVFINSEGLPTYEAKELGLTKEKFKKYPDLEESIIVTANEQNAYFKVVLAALKEIFPEIASRMKHLSHGLLRPSSGKMSSRKGNVVSAEDLISDFMMLVEEKIKDREFNKEEKVKLKEEVSIAAIKFAVLRQAIGGDVIYDPNKAVSFDGDSGPYLQYATVRAYSVLGKTKEEKVEKIPEKVDLLERLIIRFPEVIKRAREEYAPHHIVTYLLELSGAFNSYYAHNQIIGDPYRVVLTKVFAQTMKNGLWVLGIKVPERM
jgi:arginyl-tRNA synthetase